MSLRKIRSFFRTEGRKARSLLRKELATLGKNASGKTSSSIESQLIFTSKTFGFRIVANESLLFIDSGRKAGKAPPSANILNWIADKGIRGINKKGKPISNKSLAYLIGRSIANKGIKPTNIIENTFPSIFEKDIEEKIIELNADSLNDEFIESIKKEGIKTK